MTTWRTSAKRRYSKKPRRMSEAALAGFRESAKTLGRRASTGDLEDSFDEYEMAFARLAASRRAASLPKGHKYAMAAPVYVYRGDITRLPERYGAIVNAARPLLEGGGGVDGAIHAAAGESVLREIIELKESGAIDDETETGGAVITNAGRLRADYVVHVVGPVYSNQDSVEELDSKRELLSLAYTNALELADAWGAKSIAFPLVSSGAYGWPLDDAAEVAVNAVLESGTQIPVTFVGRSSETVDNIEYALDYAFEGA